VALAVEGLSALSRAFAVADATLATELKDELRRAAEPVRESAQAFMLAQIPVERIRWDEFRIGVTRSSVYVAPARRQTRDPRRKRKNFANILLGRAMLPALEKNIGEVERRVDHVLATVGRRWEETP
jgi:hypothetical protein